MRTSLSRALARTGRRNAQRDFLEEAEWLVCSWQKTIDKLHWKTERYPQRRQMLRDRLESLKCIRRDAELELFRLRRLTKEETIDAWHRKAQAFRCCDRRFTAALKKIVQR